MKEITQTEARLMRRQINVLQSDLTHITWIKNSLERRIKHSSLITRIKYVFTRRL